MPQRRQTAITFEIKREFKKKTTKGKLSSIIDFNNTKRDNNVASKKPTSIGTSSISSEGSVKSSSNNVTPRKLNKSQFIFKSKKLNRFTEESDEDEGVLDEPKQFIFNSDLNNNSNNQIQNKSNKNSARDAKTLNIRNDDKSLKLKNEVVKRSKIDNAKKPETSSRLKNNTEKKVISKKNDETIKKEKDFINNESSEDIDYDEIRPKLSQQCNKKSFLSDNHESDDDVVVVGCEDRDRVRTGCSSSKKKSASRTSNYSEKIVDEKKVEKTMKMLESILKETKKIKTPEEEDDKEKGDKEKAYNKEKSDFFKEKNIQMNKSVEEVKNVDDLVKKPVKKNIASELTAKSERSFCESRKGSAKNLPTMEDELQNSPNGNFYVKNLIDQVHKMNDELNIDNNAIQHEKETSIKQDENFSDKKKSKKQNVNKRCSSAGLSPSNQSHAKSLKDMDKNNERFRSVNSLGLTLEAKHGISMVILSRPSLRSLNKTGKLNKNESVSIHEEVLTQEEYHNNLEELISNLASNESDDNYLKIAKLNRLKVISELSMKLIGRKYRELSDEEKCRLEAEANRFSSSYPMPSEEDTSAPIKLVEESGDGKIEINEKFRIDPDEFVKIYTSRIINHAQDSTGLQFDKITVTIPAAFGTQQREAIKNSVTEGANREDIQILTRPMAAAVVLEENKIENVASIDKSNETEKQKDDEGFKVVFDMTEASIDASVIRIKESNDFQVVSNVGDTSFGLNDLDERIVEYLAKAKLNLPEPHGEQTTTEAETLNTYSNLVKNVKESLRAHGGSVLIELKNLNCIKHFSESSKSENEIAISEELISEILCKDIYDWCLAHIEKAISQAGLNTQVDEIILIGAPTKMPGFKKYLAQAYPSKRVNFVNEAELALGAAIVGQKIKLHQIKITEVLCRSIGVGLYTGVITYLLFRNSSLPCQGGCVYSTLVDDQESMVLDVYEGERPHIKFCRYLGEVIVLDLPKGRAGSVKCEVYLKMNPEGLLEAEAKELSSGCLLRTEIDSNPENLENAESMNNFNNCEQADLDPIEAERHQKQDYDLVYELETLDEYLEEIYETYLNHDLSEFILNKIFDTKEYIYKRRKSLSVEDCRKIRTVIDNFLQNLKN